MNIQKENFKNNKEYYINLLEEVQTLKPETAYYLERAWFYVFQL